ncbi:hypothetical protein FZEAL_8032 [Fusarium zealandicum]|uniref:NACHT domain-containing protein n=1 Tax=Fusarium zealandicum TaxID=1053134 RepID=A0A8H4UEN2_9HYPO|nr:hypothetical protein FZEAL_8032 [Fusarium zealandicum]
MSSRDSLVLSDDSDVVFLGRDDVSDYNADNILAESPETIAKIREWLRPTDYDLDGGEYRKHLAAHLENTGEWLPCLDAYKTWHDGSSHGLLWIKGVPGSGKSVVAASMAQKLSQEDVPVLFFFFRQIVDANHRPIKLLRDWLDQILIYSPPLQATLNDFIDEWRTLESVSVEELWRHLRTALASIPLTYCVVDALDEMDQGNEDFIRSLAELGHWRPSTVKVLMTSRPVASVEMPMRRIDYVEVRMEERLVDIDIATYVRHCLDDTSLLENDRQLIKKAVPGRANGLFLYAKLVMKAFLEPNADISRTLQRLPLDLDDMYIGILQEYASRSGISEITQVLILQWATHAVRPLRLLELASLLKTTVDGRRSFSLKDNKDLVRAACGPLLEILPDETVSVVHHSLTEFLAGTSRSQRSAAYPVLDPGSTHCHLASTCLAYLYSGCLISTNDSLARLQMNMDFPFALYAINNWCVHATRSSWNGTREEPLSIQLEALWSDHYMRNRWIGLCLEDPVRRPVATEDDLEDNQLSDLHLAAIWGLEAYVPVLIQRQPEDTVDVLDESGRTPLWWAAYRGHAGVVRLLLEAGAAPDPEYLSRRRPLLIAATNGCFEVVQLLLDNGVDPMTGSDPEDSDDDSEIHDTPLERACQNGHVKTVEVLLPFLTRDAKHLALHWAVYWSQPHLVKRLLQEPDIDLNEKVKCHTPLFVSAARIQIESMEMLVDAGADASIKCKPHREYGLLPLSTQENKTHWHTALAEFCRHESRITTGLSSSHEPHCTIDEFSHGVSLLVRAGADVNGKDALGRALIHESRNVAAAKILLHAGADPNLETPDGQTALHLLPKNADEEYIKLLVKDRGVDVNKRELKTGKTPLLIAISEISGLALATLLSCKPDCNAIDSRGNTALHYAFLACRMRITTLSSLVSTLLEGGADPAIANCDGETPLHVLARSASPEFCLSSQRLANFSASIDVRDSQGRTPFFHLLRRIDPMDQDILLYMMNYFRDTGAKLDTRDNRGRTLLHEAVRLPYLRDNPTTVYQHLVDQGLSPCEVDFKGNTLCHEFILANHFAHDVSGISTFFPLFEKAGLDIEQPNFAGRVPLHFVCQMHVGTTRSGFTAIECFEWLIEHSCDPNVADKQGIRPIHLAASTFEEMAYGLIRAGADPFVTTNQGMNALHIASRCRRSNSVGLLLERMKELSPSAMEKASNQKDDREFTPLHYASRSGILETVLLLLEAGADVNPTFTGSPIMEVGEPWYPPVLQCIFFKHEQSLWGPPPVYPTAANPYSPDSAIPDIIPPDSAWLAAAGYLIQDTNRPSKWLDPDPEDRYLPGYWSRAEASDLIRSSRWDEITRVLLAAGADMYDTTHWEGTALYSAMKFAAHNCYDHLTEFLSKCHEKIGGPELPEPVDVAIAISRARRQSDSKLLGESVLSCPQETTWRTIEHLLKEREYSLISKLYKSGANFTAEGPRDGYADGLSILELLGELGFSTLVDECCSVEEVKRVDGIQQRSQQTGTIVNRLSTLSLITACKSEAPSMPMLRVFVGQRGANPDALYYRGTSALHELAQGMHWWHIAQAIPYLVSQGADLEARDSTGRTPLQYAVTGHGPFHTAAAKTLIGLGADVNAVDSHGENCLDRATRDEDLFRFLVAKGVEVRPRTVVSAVEAGNVGILKALFSGQGSAGLAKSWNLKLGDIKWQDGVSRRGCEHPLYQASGTGEFLYHGAYMDFHQKSCDMIRILLEAGVSPYDTYPFCLERESRIESPSTFAYATIQAWNVDYIEPSEVKNSEYPRQVYWFAEKVVLHQIIIMGNTIKPIMELPDLDVEYRDGTGKTLLMAACRRARGSSISPIDDPLSLLLERGADPFAVDVHGRNVLHHQLGSRATNSNKLEALKKLGDAVPALINKVDSFGYYPLHYGLAVYMERHWPTEGLDVEWLTYIIMHGAEITVTDTSGNNALHYLACSMIADYHLAESSTSRFKQLVGLGLDINSRNHAGKTPVFFLRAGRMRTSRETIQEVMLLLNEMGADWQARDDKERTVLHDLVQDEDYLFKEMLEMGVDPLLEDIDGRSSLDLAVVYERFEILAMFEQKNEDSKK